MNQWNDFDYEDQEEVLTLMETLLPKCPKHLKECLLAAIAELEIWANSPIQQMEPDGRIIAEAQFEEE
jgi:hypothetical protein